MAARSALCEMLQALLDVVGAAAYPSVAVFIVSTLMLVALLLVLEAVFARFGEMQLAPSSI